MPFTILRLKDEEAIVLEMGMNHLGEISLLTQIAKPNICVITNIGTSHIGNLGSRENILKAKLEILEGENKKTVIINKDNDLLSKWEEENKGKMDIITYSIKEEKSDIKAEKIKLKENGSTYTCKINQKDETINVPVGGEHFILNSLCAICVGKKLNIETQKIIEGIEEFELTKKRMDIKELENGIKIINDAYNASFESMQASLKYLGELKNGRKIAVLGDMLELGKYAKELHKKVGKEVYKNKIDILICSGENAKYIIDEAKKEGMSSENIYYFESKDEIEKKLNKIKRKGDAILFKASNGMKFFDIAQKM